MKNVKPMLFAMPNSKKLGEKIANKLHIKLTNVNKKTFADGEILVSSEESVRNKHVYIIAATNRPANDKIMELLIFVDSLKRASAKTITLVLTYYGYARQDRKAAGRQPITAKLVANLFETAGISKIISVDLHNPSIQGFFNIPLDELRGQYIFAPEIKKNGKFTVASPDHGGANRARLLAELISNSVHIAIVDKRRISPNTAETMGVLGNVQGKNVVIIDDMIDTGGTIIQAAKIIKKSGANKIIIAATHGIFSKGFQFFENEKDIDKVIVTDTLESVYDIKSKKLQIISMANLLSKSIKATIESQSIGAIYETIRKKMN